MTTPGSVTGRSVAPGRRGGQRAPGRGERSAGEAAPLSLAPAAARHAAVAVGHAQSRPAGRNAYHVAVGQPPPIMRDRTFVAVAAQVMRRPACIAGRAPVTEEGRPGCGASAAPDAGLVWLRMHDVRGSSEAVPKIIVVAGCAVNRAATVYQARSGCEVALAPLASSTHRARSAFLVAMVGMRQRVSAPVLDL